MQRSGGSRNLLHCLSVLYLLVNRCGDLQSACLLHSNEFWRKFSMNVVLIWIYLLLVTNSANECNLRLEISAEISIKSTVVCLFSCVCSSYFIGCSLLTQLFLEYFKSSTDVQVCLTHHYLIKKNHFCYIFCKIQSAKFIKV